MREVVTITAKALRACILVAVQRGISPDMLLGPLGADPALLEDADAHVPFDWVVRAWAEARRLTGDPAFGLHAAEMTAELDTHVIDYVCSYCRCAREMLEAVQRYQRLLMSRAELGLTVAGGAATFWRRPEALDAERLMQLEDFVVAQWALRLRARSERGFPLRRVTLRHEAPADVSEYARIFQAPVEFGQERGAIEFDAGLLDLEFKGSDSRLVGLLRRHADALVAALPEPTSTADALRRHLMQLPPATPAEANAAARALGMSERSLQRRLSDEGTSFKEVLDGVRRDLSFSYLRDPRHSISDVAFLVGFAEVSAFSRAFRRWTRESPARWRRAHGALTPGAKFPAPPAKKREGLRR